MNPLNAIRIETMLNEEGVLVLRDLPFGAGKSVEVFVVERYPGGADGEINNDSIEDAGFWKAASSHILQELWDNDDDAVYDTL